MSEQPKLCLIHLFNHRFERVLPLLDRLYGERFTQRHTIMPFAHEPGPNLSRVHELGRNFSGHLAQAARDFIRPGITHYVVVADDLLVNPRLDETNLLEALNLGPGEGYIKNLCAVDALRATWIWAGEAAAKFRRNAKALAWQELLPSADEASARFAALGITLPEQPGGSTLGQIAALTRFAGQSGWGALEGLTVRGASADYPLLSGYSDFLVIPAEAIDAFTHYCGVLAAMEIFAEVAIPTALALACPSVRTEMPLNHHFHWKTTATGTANTMKGVELWTEKDSARLAPLLSGSLEQVLADFPSDALYIHPVKAQPFRLTSDQ